MIGEEVSTVYPKDFLTLKLIYYRLNPNTLYTFHMSDRDHTSYCTQVNKGNNFYKVFNFHTYSLLSDRLDSEGNSLPYSSKYINRQIYFEGFNRVANEKLSDVINLGTPGTLTSDQNGQLAFYYSIRYSEININLQSSGINTTIESTSEFYIQSPRGVKSNKNSLFNIKRYSYNMDDSVVL